MIRASEPSARMTTLSHTIEAVWAGVETCRRCDLWRCGNGVAGEGPRHARLCWWAKQPGDQEEQARHPFVGPAGQGAGQGPGRGRRAPRRDLVTNA